MCYDLFVDNRLASIGAHRPGRLRKQDLPALASALVGYLKGFGRVTAGVAHGLSYVRLYGSYFDILVIETDWIRLLPYLRDGTLGTTVYPSPQVEVSATATGADFGDPTLYQRTLTLLTQVFSDAEPYGTHTVTQGFTPTLLPGVFCEFDASRAHSVSLQGSGVSVWRDTVRGQDAYQATPALRPSLNPSALNGLPGVVFDGTQWLDLPLSALNDWSVFVVGKYAVSPTNPIGGFLVASGYEGLKSGVECFIKQNASPVPVPGPGGRLTTRLYGDFAPISPYNDAVPADTFKLLYWSQASQVFGGSRARIGLHADVDLAGIVGDYNLSQEGWDTSRQLLGNPPPLRGAIGRYSGGPDSYLVGTICAVLIYNRVLSTTEHSQVSTYLNNKWGGNLL